MTGEGRGRELGGGGTTQDQSSSPARPASEA